MNRLIQNTVWRIEAITPTNRDLPRFDFYDPYKKSPKITSSGSTQKFYIEWVSSGPDTAATDSDRREAFHLIQIHVLYPVLRGLTATQDTILEDRHDLLETLRNDNSLKGYNDANSTADIGLYHRERTRDNVDRSDERLWIYSSEWRCKVRESEI